MASLWVSPALADDVKVVSTPVYGNSKVTGLDGLKLLFTLSSGGKLNRDLSEVELILIDGQESFNKAEKEYADGEYDKAVKSYTTAMDRAGNDWMKKLVTVRRLRALSRNGPVDQAARDWAVIVASDGKAAASLAPQKFGAKGSKPNADAIKTLEAAAEKTKGAGLAEIQKVLLELYKLEGQKDKAEALLNSGVPADDGAASSLNAADASATLRDAERLLASKPQDALEMVRRRINSFTANDLSKALMITGRAQQAMAERISPTDAERKEERQRLLAAAGLDFMRIAVFFSGSDNANEALLQAGHCNRDIGNINAARATYKLLTDYFENTEQAKKAAEALATLDKK